MTGFTIVALEKMLGQLGEEKCEHILSQFSCPLNKDVEEFIQSKKKIIEFSKQKIAMSYLVLASYKKSPVVVGYFTISNKFIVIPSKILSKTFRKRISKFATYESNSKTYQLACPLIAQLAKNYTNNYCDLISGSELLELACRKVKEAQMVVGGKTVYLECEEVDKLIDFYRHNGFYEIGKRKVEPDEEYLYVEKHLVQLLKYIH